MNTGQLVTLADPRSAAAEAYRALRINLAYTSLDKALEVLVISSPGPESAKPFVAANLAVVMAQAGLRVVLVDADLRRPRLHELFGVPQEPGLTSLMLSEAAVSEPQLLETVVPGVSLLPAGAQPPNPADILGSQKMEQLLRALKAQADVVIFDTPPVNVAVDAAVLATKADGLLLTVRYGYTRRDHIAQAQETLERFRARLLGAVLVDAPEVGFVKGY